MTFDVKLKDMLQRHKEDIDDANFVSVIADAYLQGGKECVMGLKKLLDGAGIDKKLFNDAVEKIIADLLRTAIS